MSTITVMEAQVRALIATQIATQMSTNARLEQLELSMQELQSDRDRMLGDKKPLPRHADHPKMPCTAYLFYSIAVRDSMVASNPGVSRADIVGKIAKMWQTLPKADQAPYVAQAAADKARYDAEMIAFKAAHPETPKPAAQSRPSKVTAYQLFCNENREHIRLANPDKDGKEITKLLCYKWEETKKTDTKYQAMADKANKGAAA